MIATLKDGTKKEFRPGAPLMGYAFTAIEFTHEDYFRAHANDGELAYRKFYEWVEHCFSKLVYNPPIVIEGETITLK